MSDRKFKEDYPDLFHHFTGRGWNEDTIKACLEYIEVNREGGDKTQKEIAEKHDTTQVTVSEQYRKVLSWMGD